MRGFSQRYPQPKVRRRPRDHPTSATGSPKTSLIIARDDRSAAGPVVMGHDCFGSDSDKCSDVARRAEKRQRRHVAGWLEATAFPPALTQTSRLAPCDAPHQSATVSLLSAPSAQAR